MEDSSELTGLFDMESEIASEVISSDLNNYMLAHSNELRSSGAHVLQDYSMRLGRLALRYYTGLGPFYSTVEEMVIGLGAYMWYIARRRGFRHAASLVGASTAVVVGSVSVLQVFAYGYRKFSWKVQKLIRGHGGPKPFLLDSFQHYQQLLRWQNNGYLNRCARNGYISIKNAGGAIGGYSIARGGLPPESEESEGLSGMYTSGSSRDGDDGVANVTSGGEVVNHLVRRQSWNPLNWLHGQFEYYGTSGPLAKRVGISPFKRW